MKYLDYILQFPKLFDWYFALPAIKRIQLNYIILLTAVASLAYYNDRLHRENIIALSNRIDATNALRSKDQDKYTVKLEYYTDKFNHLLEIFIEQKKEIKEIKK